VDVLSFEAYCRKKKIDPDLFRKSDPERYQEWETLFEQIHPDSFTEQKKFLINPIRKQYLLVEVVKESTEATAPSPVKPAVVKIPPFKKG
jgi:hypothetical protein